MRETFNLTEAAETLGVHRNTLPGWIASGRLKAKRVGKEWEIPASEIERLSTPDPEKMRTYSGTVDAAEMFTAWREQTEKRALADVLTAAHDLLAAWKDAGHAINGAPVVQGERMENVNAQLGKLVAAAKNIERLRDLAPLERAIRSHAIKLGREADEALNTAVAATRALAP